jgi:hypothetical protein
MFSLMTIKLGGADLNCMSIAYCVHQEPQEVQWLMVTEVLKLIDVCRTVENCVSLVHIKSHYF